MNEEEEKLQHGRVEFYSKLRNETNYQKINSNWKESR